MLLLNTIRAKPGATSQRRRRGRGVGSGMGTTAGKGDKGQLARTGGRVRAGFEGGQTPLYRRLPKVGFKNFARRDTYVLNVGDFSRGSLADLKEISPTSIKKERLAILGDGEIKKAITVKAHRITDAAREKIEKAGGKVEILQIPGMGRKGKLKKKQDRTTA